MLWVIGTFSSGTPQKSKQARTLATTVGADNPFRYRGYYFDSDTGLYYLNSRYYDSTVGRFINADGLVSASSTLLGTNMYGYCENNPIIRSDTAGEFWDTVFDILSLMSSVVDVCANPDDPWAWAGLVGDTIDLIPLVTGVGEVTRAISTVDRIGNTVQISKAVDFSDDAADLVKTLDRSNGFTKSSASLGVKIHDGYKSSEKFNPVWKEFKGIPGIRPDYVDFDANIIFELKPMNQRGIRDGVRQLQKYNEALGGGFTLMLELY